MEAETIARWLIHQHPQFSGARIVLGRVLFEQDRLSEAADVLRATTIQYPASVAAYRWLAEVLVRQGLWARARAVLNQAAMLSPANRRIGQLQRLAGQTGGQENPFGDEPTTGAMNLGEPPRLPIPAQGLSLVERRNGLGEEDPTPRGVAPPDTPLYARPDFAPATAGALVPASDLEPLEPVRATLEWPAAPPRRSDALVPSYSESATINILRGPTGEPTAIARTPPVTWKGVPFLDNHWRQHWQKGVALAAGLLATACVGFLGLRLMVQPRGQKQQQATSSFISSATESDLKLPAAITDALTLATPESLRNAAQMALTLEETAGTVAEQLARALLVVEYGETSAGGSNAPSPDLPDALPANLSDLGLASQTLHALARGQLAQARSLVQGAQAVDAEAPWVPLAQARLLQRMGNLDAAREQLAALSPKLPVVALLASELAIDDGRPAEAIRVLTPLAAALPQHPRVKQLMAQAQMALHPEQAPKSLKCDVALLPNLLLDCQSNQASLARRSGHREEAIAVVAKASADGVTDPRALSEAIVTFANLGQVGSSKRLMERLNSLAQPSFEGRAWADLAVNLAGGPGTNLNVPARPFSAETRLLASRAAFARGGTDALAGTLASVGDTAIGADDDLRWWRLLTRYGSAEGMQVSSKLMRSRSPMGPVGTFVAGLLAENSRRLTSHWMGLALAEPGYGDRCWAARLYAQAQRSLGEDPTRLPAYQSLMASGICH